MSNKVIYCGNCGKIGHTYRRCLAPIISLGVVLFKIEKNIIQYLFVQRRDTLGFVEFMRGKYNLENIEYVYELLKIMTLTERENILNNDFDTLWNALWMDKNNKKFHNEYASSKNKFIKLKQGFVYNDSQISLEIINKKIPCLYLESEWGFPKGRRNLKENDIDCAKREFEEESGYKSNEYIIIDKEKVFEEIFSGTNNIRYKHVYYIGKSINNKELNIDKNNFCQFSEIKNIKWFSFSEGSKIIRKYNKEKLEILKKANDFISKKYINKY
jgi:predicted NUDIX family NTP pyrophosphohydrolase